MYDQIQSTIRRKEAIKKLLFQYFGYEKKIYIDEELPQIELLLMKHSFQEVLEMIKENIQIRISSKYLPQKYIKPIFQENSRSVSTDKLKSSRISLTNRNQRSVSESWEDYNLNYANFHKEFVRINSNFEKNQIKSYRKTPNLDYLSQLDEIKAIESRNLGNIQGEEIEKKRTADRYFAEKQLASILSNQILDRENINKKIKLEKKKYQEELAKRDVQLKAIDLNEKERKKLDKKIYNLGLNEQIQSKIKEKIRMRELIQKAGDISSIPTPGSGSSVASGLPRESPLKFLVQYGRYLPKKPAP